MYKPNFCSECGSKIERSRWHPWTSRRFCSDCEPRFRKGQIRFTLVTGAALFLTGLLFGRAARPAPPPLLVERGDLPAVSLRSTDKGKQVSSAVLEKGNAPASDEPIYGPDGTSTERPTEPTETISVCGARTQKGTPCQRRVRGIGRCWQHKGMPAILPPAKLIIQG